MSEKRYNVYTLCVLAIENDFAELLKLILDKFGDELGSKYYYNCMIGLKHVKKTRLYQVFDQYWKKYYYNDAYANCSKVDKKRLIKLLWKSLPIDPLFKNEYKKTTMKEIEDVLNSNEIIYKLNGKYMHFIGGHRWNKVPTFNFDSDMNKFGKFKSMCDYVYSRSIERVVKKIKMLIFC